MKKKILFVINTLGGAGAEMALLELLEKLEKENEKTKDVQYEISLYVLMGQGELVKKLPKEVLLKNKSYQPLSVLQKEGRHFMYRPCSSGVPYSVCCHIFCHHLRIC